MKSTARLYIRNPFPIIWAIGAFLLVGTAGSAVQPQAGMAATALSPASSQTIRSATSAQRSLAAAAVSEGVQIEWNAGLGTPSSIRGKDLGARQSFSAGMGLKAAKSAQPEANAIAVLDNLSGIMGIREAQKEFAAKPAQGDSLGFRHVRADQTYQGLKVFGGEVIVHFNKEGAAYQVNGRYVSDIALDINPALTPEDALALATKDLAGLGKSEVAPVAQPELVIFAYQSAPRLAYSLTLTCEPTAVNAWRYWIDAQDGKVLMRYNDIKMASVTITGTILAGEGGGITNVNDCFSDGATNYLFSTVSPWGVINISTDSLRYPDAMSMAFRTNTFWTPEDRTEMSAAANIDHIQQYFTNVYHRNSFDNNPTNGAMALVVVHYGTDYVNAFWDGTALWIGDGDGTKANPLAVLDICGHEFTHAVTEYSANLVYSYESGALNESFSDIFGAAVEFYAQPDRSANYPDKIAGTADWLMGEDSWLSSTALRDMRNPSNAGTVGAGNEQPSRYKSTFWYAGSGDNGGVHINSGVQNFFFYLLSEGGSGTNFGHAYSVTGIGVSNAAQIAYRTLTVYCAPYTDYTTIRTAWISAAQDLNPAWVASVIQAWDAVGYGVDIVTDLGTVLNAPYLTWLTGGNANWYGQSLITNHISTAAQSGLIGTNASSRLSTTVTGPGTFSFWWKVWSEQDFDYLKFYFDNVLRLRISGQSGDWAQIFISVGAGPHTLQWVYSKDISIAVGLDAGWLSEVAWAPVWTVPVSALTVTSGSFADRIRITWPNMSGATSYRLYRSLSPNFGEASFIVETSSAIYDDTTAVPGTTYYYWLQGVNCATLSSLSGSASGYRALSPPTGFSASKGAYTGKVRLTWTAAAGAVSYRVMRSTSANPNTATVIVETGATSYNDTTALPGITYYYWLVSRKFIQGGNILASGFSTIDFGWRRSMAATDNAFCDFDGDGKADPAVYQRATGRWTIMMSANRYRISTFQLGGSGFLPVPQDFDGDGKTDIAVYSQATGQWLVLLSASGYTPATTSLGGPGSIPLPRDFDGDGKADPAVFDTSAGLWKAQYSSLHYALITGFFGDSSYTPSPADFDGDGRTDPAVFQVRPSVLGNLGYLLAIQSAYAYAPRDWSLSAAGQIVPQDYDGDAQADPALFDAAAGLWNIWPSSVISSIPYSLTIGGAGFIPVAGDYDGDRKADIAVYQESTGTWIVRLSASNYSTATQVLGGPGFEAVAALP